MILLYSGEWSYQGRQTVGMELPGQADCWRGVDRAGRLLAWSCQGRQTVGMELTGQADCWQTVTWLSLASLQ